MRPSSSFGALIIFVALAASALAEPDSAPDTPTKVGFEARGTVRGTSITGDDAIEARAEVEAAPSSTQPTQQREDEGKSVPIGSAKAKSKAAKPRVRLSKRVQAKLAKRAQESAKSAPSTSVMDKRAPQSAQHAPQVVTVLVARNVPMNLINQALKMKMGRRSPDPVEQTPGTSSDASDDIATVERRELSMLDPRCFGSSDRDVLHHPYEDRKYIRGQIRQADKAAKAIVKAANWGYKSEAHMSQDRRPSNWGVMNKLWKFFHLGKRALREEGDADGIPQTQAGQLRSRGLWKKLTHRRGSDLVRRGEEQHELFLRNLCRRDILRASVERRQAPELQPRLVGLGGQDDLNLL